MSGTCASTASTPAAATPARRRWATASGSPRTICASGPTAPCDETGAAIGVAIATGLEPDADRPARRVQNDLFDVGADLSVPLDTERGHGKSRLRITDAHVTALERACDELGGRLEPLTSFVLSGGTPAAAALHLARTDLPAGRAARRRAGRGRAGEPGRARLPEPALRPALRPRPDRNDDGRADVLWRAGRIGGRAVSSAAPRARAAGRARALDHLGHPLPDALLACRRRRRLRPRPRRPRAAIRTRAASTRRCTAASRGRCASSRGSARPRRRTAASATCSTTARPASRPPSTCPR